MTGNSTARNPAADHHAFRNAGDANVLHTGVRSNNTGGPDKAGFVTRRPPWRAPNRRSGVHNRQDAIAPLEQRPQSLGRLSKWHALLNRHP
jgi:hypothetical protein